MISISATAQQRSISGIVLDSANKSPLIGVSIRLLQARDSLNQRGTVTDTDGKFNFSPVRSTHYTLVISYVGYTSREIKFEVNDGSVDLGTISLGESSTMLNGVVVQGASIQVEQKGDTIQYNANAFKVTRDATAEDLIGKMPGITSDNTGIKAQGEAVQKVLVDGKEFFGDDATLAMKNLPAEIIEKVEVFDRMSEQSQLTGFDDGQTQKTINIVTRKGRNQGVFGRLYAGVSNDGLYATGGNVNSFKGARKLSVIGQSNNVNQQNFSNEDLLGVMGSSGGGNRGGGRGGRGGGGNNFSIGQQSGISTTHAVGLNYIDEWSKKIKVSGSYFFNNTINERLSVIDRQYITSRDSGLVYQEDSRANNRNFNHRANFRLEYQIDSVNTLILTPRFSFQNNNARSRLFGNYESQSDAFERALDNANRSENEGYNFANSILFRHRFAKRGRSLSVNVTTEMNQSDGNGILSSTDVSVDTTMIVNQNSDNTSESYVISSSIDYTEPVGKRGQIQISYSPSFRKSDSDKLTYNNDPESNTQTLDSLLTNTFDNTYINQRGGIGYRYNVKKFNFNSTVNFQHAQLKSDQLFPYEASVDRSFTNVVPQFSMNYKFTNTRNIRVQYRSSSNAPSISQLQNVVDNRNPLFLRTGNPNLAQDFNQNISVRYGSSNIEKSTSLLMLVNANFVNDYITNTSIIAGNDTTVNDIPLARGTQLSYPVNVDGYYSLRGLVTYGFPLKVLKSNMNVSSGINFNNQPALINQQRNVAKNYALNQSVVLSSNINERIDFTVSTNANYTIVKNSLQRQANNNYWNFVSSARLNWLFWKGFVFTTNVSNNAYLGLSAGLDQSIWYWNAGLGYKFLKNEALEVKFNAFDILNRNNSIRREITETYIEDSQVNVLQRYYLLTVTYRLSQFK
ncbi:TonB-dependent receptor [Pseudochryseolinea flava]|uniref:TonB-dependent receptor n=1 Tax=Pseudochryseolinea flava TaxID=2059302 RepID=UPI001FEA9886|nr:outer membrane beta-barrel protein [Pseudochryseolinea flava]